MSSGTITHRQDLVKRGQRLEYFTVGYNLLEAFVSLAAGWMSGSVSLVGFGLDSLIEVTSGGALLWRLRSDADAERRERVERVTLRIVGGCFLALALYVLAESVARLAGHETPERSLPGIVIAAASVIVMPLLANAKRRVATAIHSRALHADSRQTDFCLYLALILLAGLLLNALAGWWWADAAAGLAMVPLIAREGIASMRGKSCECR